MHKLKLAAALFLVLTACSAKTVNKHYILAEKLWQEGRYHAAVLEYEKVTRLDPGGKLGLQALFRAATTQMLFTHQYNDAIDKFQLYIKAADPNQNILEAKKQVAEIYYSKLQDYEQAIKQLSFILKTENPPTQDLVEFRFRIARSYFYLKKFDLAIEEIKDVINAYKNSHIEERAMFEKAQMMTTWASQKNELYSKAQDALAEFLKKYPNSDNKNEALFLKASVFEEQEKLDQALEIYESIQSSYTSPKVIQIKLARIHERLDKKNTTKGLKK